MSSQPTSTTVNAAPLHQAPSISQPTYNCPQCNRAFNSDRGLKIHLGRMHPEGRAGNGPGSLPSAPPVIVPGVDPGTQRPCIRDELLRCRESVKIVNIIPKAVRQIVAEELRVALHLVCTRNDEDSWRDLLASAPVVLQMPPVKHPGDSWPKITRRNIAAYKNGARFE